MTLPIIKENQYVLLRAQYDSGIILNNDGSFWTGEEEANYYYIVQSKVEALTMARELIVAGEQEIEVIIYNFKGELFDYIEPRN